MTMVFFSFPFSSLLLSVPKLNSVLGFNHLAVEVHYDMLLL